jgi:hypothetical protein
MQFALLFATFNLIYAVALPGMGSSLTNSLEKKVLAMADRALQKSIDNPQSLKAIENLRGAQKVIAAVEDVHAKRQNLMDKFINLVNLMGNTEKAVKINARKARKATEMRERISPLKAKVRVAKETVFQTLPPIV